MAKQLVSQSTEEVVVEAKAKKSHKRKIAPIDDEEVENIESGTTAKKRKKKEAVKRVAAKTTTKKLKSKIDIFDEDEDDEPSQKITIHLFIESTIPSGPTSKSRSKATASSAIKTLQRGPIFHDTADNFEVLQATIAKLAPCAVKNLVVSKMQWKFETPLGGLRKLLANDMGYNALLSAAKAKKGDVAVFVFMPPPVKVEEVWLAFDTIIVGSNDGFVRHGSLAKQVKFLIRWTSMRRRLNKTLLICLTKVKSYVLLFISDRPALTAHLRLGCYASWICATSSNPPRSLSRQ